MAGKRYVTVTEDLWTDAKFLKLSSEARLLFIWSWMPPHANVCGIYKCSLRDLERALGASVVNGSQGLRERVERALDELRSLNMLHFDGENEVLWVVNKVKYVAKTAKTAAFMQKELRRVPDSPLVEQFVRKWGRMLNVEGVK
jgi:hypothetical protein